MYTSFIYARAREGDTIGTVPFVSFLANQTYRYSKGLKVIKTIRSLYVKNDTKGTVPIVSLSSGSLLCGSLGSGSGSLLGSGLA